jgi:hypothetical protein
MSKRVQRLRCSSFTYSRIREEQGAKQPAMGMLEK